MPIPTSSLRNAGYSAGILRPRWLWAVSSLQTSLFPFWKTMKTRPHLRLFLCIWWKRNQNNY